MSTVEQVRPDPRITRRRRAVERARRRTLTTRVVGGVAGAVMVWTIFWSPLLEVDNITVRGATHTTALQLTEVTDVVGENLLFVSAADVAKDAEELPWVAAARVDRVLPNTLRVRIVERSPALVLTTESESWIVSGSGHVLQRARGNEDLPSMGASDLGTVVPGERLTRPSLRDGVRAYASMPRALAELVEMVVAPTSERISFSLRGGTVVRYGAAEEMGDKNEVILALLERFGGDERQLYFDVRVPSNPAVSSAAPE